MEGDGGPAVLEYVKSIDGRLGRMEQRLEEALGLRDRVSALEADASERTDDARDRRQARRGYWGNGLSAAIGAGVAYILGVLVHAPHAGG